MPRKRTTRMTQRKKPKQPEEESSHSMAEEEEQARLESFLKDFDVEVGKRVLSMRAQMKSMCNTIHHAFNLEILKLPSHLRSMRRSQIFGEKEAKEIAAEVDQQIDQLIDNTLKTAPAAQEETQTTKRGRRRKKGTTAKKSTTTTRKKRTTTDENEPSATGGRGMRKSTRPTRASTRNRNLIDTPANTVPPCGYDTPMFTPKFDPRLPVTTGRKPKRGEVTMSFAGSPVVNENGSRGQSPKEMPLLTRLQKIQQEVSETSEIEDENLRKQVFSQLNGMLNSLLKNVNEESEIE